MRGVVESALQVDPARKVKFISYAVWWIRQSVIHALTHNARICHIIRDILEALDEKEALVLKWRFGLDDDQPLTLQELGGKLHLTRERIPQIERKAMHRLSRSRKLSPWRGNLN